METTSDLILNFLPKNFEDSRTPVDRRWDLKHFRGFFPIDPRFDIYNDPRVDREDQIKRSIFIYIDLKYRLLNAEEETPQFFIGDLNFNTHESEYIFELKEIQDKKEIYTYEEEFIIVYAGYHWNNLSGLLYVLTTREKPTSDAFKELAERFRTCKTEEIPWSNETSEEDLLYGINALMKMFHKDPCKFISRYLKKYLEEILRRGGMGFLIPEWVDTFDSDLIEKCNEELKSMVNEMPQCETPIVPPAVRDNVILPPDRPSLKADQKLVIDPFRSLGGGILCYKMIPDDISDKSRKTPQHTPYDNSAIYDPPITRGVTKDQQPYRFALANADIDMDDLNGDTSNMRKIVTADTLTATLDWAAKNDRELPPLGTEFYIHIGDAATESYVVNRSLIAVYSRQRMHSNFLIPFPDYSYQVFSPNSRYHIRDSTSMTWDHTRDWVLQGVESSTIKDKKSGIFFIGNEFSYSGIRKSLHRFQDMDVKRGRDLIMKSGTMTIQIPKLDVGKEIKPISIAKMGDWKILLDLPGYGMWSNRLKFISLTGSMVVRIMFEEYFWDKKSKTWKVPDPNGGSLWETFTDSFLPIEFTHTIIGKNYRNIDYKDPESLKGEHYNRAETLKIIQKLNNIHRDISKPFFQKKADDLRVRTSTLTQDHIYEYIYELIMMQAKYYGFI